MKKLVLLSFGLLLIVALAWVYGRPAYRHFRERQAAHRAGLLLARGDYRAASLSARQALARNTNNLQACRVMAELSELAASPNALDWYRRMADLDPSPTNKLLYAAAAIRFQQPPFPLAAQLLTELAPTAAKLPAFHVVSAELALKSGNIPRAAASFENAVRLDPANDLNRLNLAVTQLQSTNPATSALARSTLGQLRSSTNVGAVALRWLVADRLSCNDLPAAQSLSSNLLQHARASLADRLQHLALLHQAKSPDFASFLTAVKTSAGTNGAAAASVADWMLQHRLDPLPWLRTCTNVLPQAPVRLATVDALVVKQGWADLEDYLKKQSQWAELEFLRLAFLSRAAEQQGQPVAAETRWRSAVREAGDRLGALNRLLALAFAWRRDTSAEDLLWQIGRQFPREKWAYLELARLYSRKDDTRALNRLYATLAERDPSDFVSKNNLVATSLLLQTNLGKAHELARELRSAQPANAVIASTYAWSLHLQGRTADALAVMQSLKPDALLAPNVALYYGLLLAASGHGTNASAYFEKARTVPMLPEEKALLAGSK